MRTSRDSVSRLQRFYSIACLGVIAFATVQCAPPDGTAGVSTPSCGQLDPAPMVAIVGDSISEGPQSDYYCWFNSSEGWRTVIRAKGGEDVGHFLGLGAFPEIAASNAKAVFVELGTNDIGSTHANPPVAWNMIISNMETAANALSSKCVIWVGQNEQWETTVPNYGLFKTVQQAKDYNKALQQRASSHPTFHYGDYDELIRTNSIFRDSVNADGLRIHPLTDAGRIEFAKWQRDLVRRHCGI